MSRYCCDVSLLGCTKSSLKNKYNLIVLHLHPLLKSLLTPNNSGETPGPMTLVNSLLCIDRSDTSSSSSSVPIATQPAYLELLPSETYYTVNTTPTENVLRQSEQCPDNLADMLKIVWELQSTSAMLPLHNKTDGRL